MSSAIALSRLLHSTHGVVCRGFFVAPRQAANREALAAFAGLVTLKEPDAEGCKANAEKAIHPAARFV